MKEKIVLGIDLGTSNSQAAYLRAGTTEPIIVKATDSASEFGKAFPTFIYKDIKTGVWTYGEAARRMALTWGFKNCAREFKKIIGILGPDGKEKKIKFADQELTGVELSSKFLRNIKEVSEEQSGQQITDCVITVPAAFDNARREATKNAAEIAGFNVLRLINEPTAAALAYKISLDVQESKKQDQVAIFDIGGGTFDFTLLSMQEGALQVTASDGDLKLGGTYMDHALMQYILRDIEKTKGLKITRDHEKYQDVLKEIEKVKIELTSIKESRFLVQDLKLPDGKVVSYDKRLQRPTFERLISPLISRIDAPINRCLSDASLSIAEIKNVILVGGPSRIPSVVKKVESLFGSEKICKAINPMECVAIGAAVQGSIIVGNTTDILLVDIVPLSVGVKTYGDIFEKVIVKGASLPCSNTKSFTNASTFTQNSNTLGIGIFQGQRIKTSDNIELGQLEIKGLPKAKRASLDISVTLEIDRNGILQVSAKCQPENGPLIQNKVTIKNSTSLTDEEIAKRIADFEKNQSADNTIKELSKHVEGIRTLLEQIESFKETNEAIYNQSIVNKELTQLITESSSLLTISLENLADKKDRLPEIKSKLEECLTTLFKEKQEEEKKKVKLLKKYRLIKNLGYRTKKIRNKLKNPQFKMLIRINKIQI